jgi:hypothetical protein
MSIVSNTIKEIKDTITVFQVLKEPKKLNVLNITNNIYL